MLGLKIRSPATVIEDESYTVRLTVTNQSTKAGLPVEVLLGVGILAGTEFITLIPSQVSNEYFAPGETRDFDYTMTVPAGSGGQIGGIVAWVEDPTGRAIAQATEDVVIVSPALPQFYMPVEMRKAMYPTIDPYTVCEVWCDITNNGDAPGTHNVHIWDSVGNVDFTIPVTLQPGETYTWHRTQWIDFSRIGSYRVKAQGDWIDNNYSEARFP